MLVLLLNPQSSQCLVLQTFQGVRYSIKNSQFFIQGHFFLYIVDIDLLVN